MAEIVGVTERRAGPSALAVPRLDVAVPQTARAYVLPVIMALLCVVGTGLSASRIGLLIDWSERYGGEGRHVVSSCVADSGRGGDSWICTGALVPDDSTADVRSDLVTSRGAVASGRPFVGQRADVFFEPDDLGTVHPVAYRLNELARLYLSLLPRLLLAGGAIIWLAGWALTRHLDASNLLVRDSVRLPGRFAWRRRGLTWLAAGVGVLVLNHLLTRLVIGSLGTF